MGERSKGDDRQERVALVPSPPLEVARRSHAWVRDVVVALAPDQALKRIETRLLADAESRLSLERDRDRGLRAVIGPRGGGWWQDAGLRSPNGTMSVVSCLAWADSLDHCCYQPAFC